MNIKIEHEQTWDENGRDPGKGDPITNLLQGGLVAVAGILASVGDPRLVPHLLLTVALFTGPDGRPKTRVVAAANSEVSDPAVRARVRHVVSEINRVLAVVTENGVPVDMGQRYEDAVDAIATERAVDDAVRANGGKVPEA
jgi:hypothetical protein